MLSHTNPNPNPTPNPEPRSGEEGGLEFHH